MGGGWEGDGRGVGGGWEGVGEGWMGGGRGVRLTCRVSGCTVPYTGMFDALSGSYFILSINIDRMSFPYNRADSKSYNSLQPGRQLDKSYNSQVQKYVRPAFAHVNANFAWGWFHKQHMKSMSIRELEKLHQREMRWTMPLPVCNQRCLCIDSLHQCIKCHHRISRIYTRNAMLRKLLRDIHQLACNNFRWNHYK